MSEEKKIIEPSELDNVSGGRKAGETIFTYCPICRTKSQKHLIISCWNNLECLKCHGHHRAICCDQAGNPDPADLQRYYDETK